MEYRERVAHHEAAHIVSASLIGARILDQGIDIDAPTSVQGAFGTSAVTIFAHDENRTCVEQQTDLMDNLVIICSGAASDAKIQGKSPSDALDRQPGDKKVALDLLAGSPVIGHETPDEKDFVLNAALTRAAKMLGQTDHWRLVEEVAAACLENGGRLSKSQIEAILNSK